MRPLSVDFCYTWDDSGQFGQWTVCILIYEWPCPSLCIFSTKLEAMGSLYNTQLSNVVIMFYRNICVVFVLGMFFMIGMGYREKLIPNALVKPLSNAKKAANSVATAATAGSVATATTATAGSGSVATGAGAGAGSGSAGTAGSGTGAGATGAAGAAGAAPKATTAVRR